MFVCVFLVLYYELQFSLNLLKYFIFSFIFWFVCLFVYCKYILGFSEKNKNKLHQIHETFVLLNIAIIFGFTFTI